MRWAGLLERLAVWAALALGILVVPPATHAQSPAKVARIGWLGFGPSTPENMAVNEPFRQGLPGLSFLNPELSAKQLQLLKEVVPKVSRVAVLQDPASVGHRIILKEAEATARALGVELQILGARVPDDFDAAFAAMTRERAGALLVLAHPTFLLYRRRLADLAEKGRLPAMYGNTEHAEAGGLMAYAPSLADNFSRSAVFVDKILKGAKPSDLPVEQPTRFQLVVNLKAAQALGLTIPQSVLIRADRVVQ